jgi:acetyltransferase-like isoleucine patch superfamily enzyme
MPVEHPDQRSAFRFAIERDYERYALDVQPWTVRSSEAALEQQVLQEVLRERSGASFGKNCYIARSARVLTNKLDVGDSTWIAEGVILRGDLIFGSNATVNPYSHIAGRVRIGNGVRIAGGVAIMGFNHGTARTDIAIYRQPTTTLGIKIGDGTWIGANAVIRDGVVIGSHAIVAGGSVVTSDVPDYAVVGGNPARIIRSRLQEARDSSN